MAIAGAGYGASKVLEEIIGEQMLRAQMAQREKQAQDEMGIKRQQIAQDAKEGDARISQGQQQLEIAERRRRDENNERGMAQRKSDLSEMDLDAAVKTLPPYLQQVSGLVKVGAMGKLSPDDLEAPEARAAREATGREQAIQDQIRVRNATRDPRPPERDPIADYEAKAAIDARYKTGQGGPSPYSQERAARTVQSVDELIGKVSGRTTGMGSLLSAIPATDARNFAAELDTLKANIAFNELTAMREASKTGGALGQVSDREAQLLQSALGALDAGQSAENLKTQLRKIKESVERWQAAAGGMAPMKPMSSRDTAPAANRVDELIAKYGRRP